MVWGQIAYLALTSFIIGFSGALVPGPVFVAVVSQATRRGMIAGPMAVVGHAALETVTAILLWFGLGIFLASSWTRSVVGLFGGTFLVWSGFELLRFARKASIQESLRRVPHLLGIARSSLDW